MDSECKSRDVLQSYFDLLGELMKFNVDAFKRFNKYINTDAKVGLVVPKGSMALAAVPAVCELWPAYPPGWSHSWKSLGSGWAV